MLKIRTIILMPGVLLSVCPFSSTTFGALDFSSHKSPRKLSLRSPLHRLTESPETIPVPRVSETWIDQVLDTEVQAIDRALPHLGFKLALYIARSGKTSVQEIFHNSLVDANFLSGNCRNMKKGKFQGGFYILKPKNSMGERNSPLETSYKHARNEIEAGARTRQAVVNAFLDNGRNLDRMLAKFDFLINLVAPIDCGDYIISVEVLNAISLWDIIRAERRSPSRVVKQSSDDIPKPDFGFDDAPLMPLKAILPTTDFGQARRRIHVARRMTEALRFLHSNRIAHNDLHSGNFLIVGNDYTQIYLIDYDQATYGQNFSPIKDQKKLVNIVINYLFGTTEEIFPEPIDVFDVLRDPEMSLNMLRNMVLKNPETFSYTDEELEQIKRTLSDLLTAIVR
jgi:hypothetical protein